MKLKISNYNAKSKKKILSYELVKKIKKKCLRFTTKKCTYRLLKNLMKNPNTLSLQKKKKNDQDEII